MVVSNDTQVLLDLLPLDLLQKIENRTEDLFEIVLDRGRQPYAWVGNQERIYLGSNDERLVEWEDIDGIIENLGGFGPDNRAGLEKQLHRISAMRNRSDTIIGLTMRVGRHVAGNANLIADHILGDTMKSILVMGEPGSGKTTVIREVTRLLAEHANVCIVDTSNEIAGDGDIPHPCIGRARRMMVRSLNEQANVMVECVQNHTPEVMVIDEIGRANEVEASRTCKERGVRLVASAHGDFRKLLKNPKLRGLVGGIETVTVGDANARKDSNGVLSKLLPQRMGTPVFDVIVELRRNQLHEWNVIRNVADAVDHVLDRTPYYYEIRTRNAETGSIQISIVSSHADH